MILGRAARLQITAVARVEGDTLATIVRYAPVLARQGRATEARVRAGACDLGARNAAAPRAPKVQAANCWPATEVARRERQA